MPRQVLAGIEALEIRRLMTSAYKGTQGADVIHIGNAATDGHYFIEINGGRSEAGFEPGDSQFFVDALAGDDKIIIDKNFKYRALIYGGAGNDTLNGGGGHETLAGNEGDDVIVCHSGNYVIGGGADNDLIDISAARSSTIYGDEDQTLTVGGALHLDNKLQNRDGSDTILGSPKDDIIFAQGGNDHINAGDGADTVYCGDGNDACDGGLGGDLLYGEAGKDVIQGEGGNDSINGGASADRLYGNGGNDTLNGAGGNDQLFGGPTDADRVLGGAGNDSAAKDAKDNYVSVETLLT